MRTHTLLMIVLAVAIGAGFLAAQEQNALPPLGSTPLGMRQQRIERMMGELEQKFKSLKLALQASEPDQAERLQLALNKAKELLLQKRMSDVTKLLDETRLDGAANGQQALLVDIHSLLELLLNEQNDRNPAQDNAQQLSARLESHFREMLATQQRLSQQTESLEKKRLDNGGQLGRADRNLARAIGEDERRVEAVRSETEPKEAGLAGKAEQALAMLTGDPMSGVRRNVERLRNDLVEVGNALADDLRTDPQTTARQKQIEAALSQLIQAMEQAQEAQPGEPGKAAAGEGVPGSGTKGEPSDSARQGPPAEGQNRKAGGGSKGTDVEAVQRLTRGGPQSPWSQLRDKQRDPVYSAIQEKFPARYQQLIEQYYKSFQDDKRE